ncbi:12486_t:CDS:2, partial [Gigaspora rosea]
DNEPKETTKTLKEIIQHIIIKGKLGSSIFISTKLFLTYINQICSNCKNENIKKKDFKIKVSGLSIRIIVTCYCCQTKSFYGNENPGANFSNIIAAAGLTGGVNHEECGKAQYFQNQEKFFNEIKNAAETSANNALHIACKEVVSKKKEILEVGFDCSWSKVREAPQASAEYIYNGIPEVNEKRWKRFEQPIMDFYTKSVYSAVARSQNPDIVSPTDNDLYLMQSEICVDHLFNKHQNCWPEICWKVQNPEIQLVNPNLIVYTQKHDLIPYGIVIKESIINQEFRPSFANLIPDFDGYILCKDVVVFQSDHQKELQQESIESFLKGQNTLTILPTGARKTLIFLVSSILSRTLTVVFTPLKAIMENQLVTLGYTRKIFSEVAAGITKVLWATPEKFIESSKFCQFLHNVSQTCGIQFVIDESHCILEFGHFRPAWSKLGQIKEEFPSAPLLLLTATCSHQEASKLATILNRADLK